MPIFSLSQNGHVTWNGMIRHKDPLICGVGSCAMWLYFYFHVVNFQMPDFSTRAVHDSNVYFISRLPFLLSHRLGMDCTFPLRKRIHTLQSTTPNRVGRLQMSTRRWMSACTRLCICLACLLPGSWKPAGLVMMKFVVSASGVRL